MTSQRSVRSAVRSFLTRGCHAVLGGVTTAFAGLPAYAEPPCYANCDASCTAPILNINDFVCFQQRFAAGDSYANCDGSTVVPILNVNDFVCFQQQFAAGCSSLPDITLTIDSAPCGLAPNQPFSATVTIRNIGQGCLQGIFFVGAWLSLDCIPENGNDPPVGGEWVEINPPLRWGESRQITLANLVAPPNPVLGQQHLIIGADTQGVLPCRMICESNEINNFDCIPMPVALTDLIVLDIILPSSPPISGNMADVQVVVRNTTYGYANNVPVTVRIGNGPLSDPVFVSLGPLCEASGTETVPVRAKVGDSPGNCGQLDPIPVTACVNFPPDPTPNNNCRTEQMVVQDPYYDLRLTFENPPNQAIACQNFTWRVRVTNYGNMHSPSLPVRILSGINCNNACGNWTCMAHPVSWPYWRDVTNIPPNGGYEIVTFNAPIICNPFLNQHLKAEICVSGCPGTSGDICTQGNCVSRPIQVR